MKIYPVLLLLLLLVACNSSSIQPNDSSVLPLAPIVSVTEQNPITNTTSPNAEKNKYPDPATLDLKSISSRPWSPPPAEKTESPGRRK